MIPDALVQWGENNSEYPDELVDSCATERVPERVPLTDDPPGKNAKEHVLHHGLVDHPRSSSCMQHVNEEARHDCARMDSQAETPIQTVVTHIGAGTVKEKENFD